MTMRPGRFLKTVQWDEISRKEFALNSTGVTTRAGICGLILIAGWRGACNLLDFLHFPGQLLTGPELLLPTGTFHRMMKLRQLQVID